MGEMEDVIEAFRVFDKEGSGSIDTKEFKQLMCSMGDKYTESEFDKYFEGCGSSIDYEEFITKLTKDASN